MFAHLVAPGLVLLVLSADRSALRGFDLDVAGYFGHECTPDVPLWLLNQQEVDQNMYLGGITSGDTESKNTAAVLDDS